MNIFADYFENCLLIVFSSTVYDYKVSVRIWKVGGAGYTYILLLLACHLLSCIDAMVIKRSKNYACLHISIIKDLSGEISVIKEN